MDTTASPSLSQALGRAAKIMRLLEQAGMTDDDFQRIINDNVLRHQFVEAWRSITVDAPKVVVVPDRPDKTSLRRLLLATLGMSTPTFQSLLRSNAFDRLLAKYTQSGVLSVLVNERMKDSRDASVLVLRYGLASGKPMTLVDIGKYYNISASRARELERRAFSRLGYKLELEFHGFLDQCVTELIASGHHPVEELDDAGRGNHSMWLKNRDVYTIEQLTTLTELEVLELMHFHHGVVDDIKEQLAVRGLKLKDA